MVDEERHPVDHLAEEFAARLRAGQQPTIDEYVRACPEHADLIRAVFASIELVERVSKKELDPRGSTAGLPESPAGAGMPTLLGDFEIIREIGRGGMGVVYEAVQHSLKRHVALKVISSLIAGSERQLRRFRREAESAAGLHHSNIVPVYGIGVDHGLQYYAMQLIDGVTLAAVIESLRSGCCGAELSCDATLVAAPLNIRSDAAVTLSPSGASVFVSESASTQFPSRQFCTDEAIQQLLGSTSWNEPDKPFAPDDAGKGTSSGNKKTHKDAAALSAESGHVTDAAESPQTIGDRSKRDRPVRKRPVWKGATVRESTPLNAVYFRNIARLMANVANALQYAHHQGILHRDIKPANLLLDRNSTIWVADFGLARKAELDGVTQTGEIVGTLRYMAPEQLHGKADARTDIYALGITLYELLTLEPALNAPQALSGQSQRQIARTPRSIRREIPADLETITLKACASEPARRYQAARDLETDLRRFLEDRPIYARRVGSIERLWRWSRRNPLIASLSAATMVLLIAIAALLGIGNLQKQKAIEAIRSEQLLTQKTLQEKTEALANVERERTRAETNLDLAVAAFEEVINNIASRGKAESLLDDLADDDNIIPSEDSVLSSADVVLLETLLGFFDRLAAGNNKDLSTQSAAARRRVADIQQQLGRLEDSERSYRTALAEYQSIAGKSSGDTSLILIQTDILQQLILIAGKRGELNRAMETFQTIRRLLTASPELRDSREGRFALATTINSMVSFGLRNGVEPRLRLRNSFLDRNNNPDDGGAPPIGPLQNARLRRESEMNAESLSLLRSLTEEVPGNVSYLALLAQAKKGEARLAQVTRDWQKADAAMNEAIGILKDLRDRHPTSARFKYELADTLSAAVSLRPADLQRLSESEQLCQELVEAWPDVPEYRSLYASTLARIAAIQFSTGRRDRAEQSLKDSLKQQQLLADQYPDVPVYQLALVRTLQQMAQVSVARNQPDAAQEYYDSAISRMEKLSSRSRVKGSIQPLLTRLRESRARLNAKTGNASENP